MTFAARAAAGNTMILLGMKGQRGAYLAAPLLVLVTEISITCIGNASIVTVMGL